MKSNLLSFFLILLPPGLLFGIEWLSTIYLSKPLYHSLNVLAISLGVILCFGLLLMIGHFLFLRNNLQSIAADVWLTIAVILSMAIFLRFNLSLFTADRLGFLIFSVTMLCSLYLQNQLEKNKK